MFTGDTLFVGDVGRPDLRDAEEKPTQLAVKRSTIHCSKSCWRCRTIPKYFRARLRFLVRSQDFVRALHIDDQAGTEQYVTSLLYFVQLRIARDLV